MRKLMGMAIVVGAAGAYGAAPVEEVGSGDSTPAPAPRVAASPKPQQVQATTAAPGGQAALIDLHYEVQALRDEVRQLRGLVEEQGHELRQLRQRQMDDYQDLDRRLSGQGGGTGRPAAALPPATERPAPSPSVVQDEYPEPSAADDSGPSFRPSQAQEAGSDAQRQEYEEIFNRLKARKVDEAQAGFQTFVAKYPESPYAANAWYWLGEIYLLQNELDGAEEAFGNVANQFPAHAKASDAKFKLGKVYHLQGNTEEAKALLTEVANGTSRSASLAQTYLQDNF